MWSSLLSLLRVRHPQPRVDAEDEECAVPGPGADDTTARFIEAAITEARRVEAKVSRSF